MRHRRASLGLCLAAGCLFWACQPETVTQAHDQLARGGDRVTRLTIPISQDTFTIGDFLSTDTTTINGLVGLRFDPDSVRVDVGNRLQFSGLNLTPVNITAPTAVFAAGGTFPIPPTVYSILAGEPRILAVDSIIAASGSLTITTRNRLPATMSYTLTLNGFRNAAGAVLTQSSTVPASNNDGTYASSTMTFNLAGVTITPGTVSATLTGSVTVPAGTNTAWATDAFTQTGTGSMVVQMLRGSLNPAQTPELVVAVENSQEIPSASVDFGDFEDAVQASTLNNATAALTVVNSSQAPVILSNFRMGAVRLNASGQLTRDGLGNLVFETDAGGNPLLVTIANPGQTTFTAARGATSAVTLQAGPLIDRIAHLLISNQRVAVVTTGTATVGDGANSRIVRTDVIRVRFQMTVALDITIPVTGVLFTRTEISEGLDVDSSDANDLAARVQQATMAARVTNGTPFGIVVQLVLVKDSVAPGVDVFTVPGRVTLDSLVVRAPAVNASGLVTAPTSDSVSVGISGANARLLFNRRFSVGARIRLLPGTGGGGRGALRATDRIIVHARAQVDVKSGG